MQVIRDGKVGVLVSRGYGSRFSTWIEVSKEIAYHPTLVDMVENNRHLEITEEFLKKLFNLPESSYVHTGGVNDLEVVWIPVGQRFFIDEYDGSEYIVMEDSINWLVGEEEKSELIDGQELKTGDFIPLIHKGNTELKGVIYTLSDASQQIQEAHPEVKQQIEQWLSQEESKA